MYICSYIHTYIHTCMHAYIHNIHTVIAAYDPKSLFGNSVDEMSTELRSRNKLQGGMHEKLWYLLLGALEQRHVFGNQEICPEHSDQVFAARIPVNTDRRRY